MCFRVVRQKGFEPLTDGLENRCSIQLSYWRALLWSKSSYLSQHCKIILSNSTP